MMQRLRNDRGQAIFLAPIGFIIVLLLGGVVLEAGNLHLRQRQLNDLADSVASNAAGAAFGQTEFRDSGQIGVNTNTPVVTHVVGLTIGESNFPPAEVGVVIQPDNDGANPRVEVVLTYSHDFIFGRQVFGASQTLTAQGNAQLIPSGGP